MFELYKGEADIIFAGDSHTARGRFDEHFQHFFDDSFDENKKADENVAKVAEAAEQKAEQALSGQSPSGQALKILNRGIGSDTTEGVWNRIDEIISHKPKKLFILTGANDIGRGVPKEDSLRFYRLIIDKVQQELPECSVYIQSVFPPSRKIANYDDEIIAFNKGLEELAREKKCEFIDLFSVFFDEKGQLHEDYISADGVHLNGKGFSAWIEAIKNAVKSDDGNTGNERDESTETVITETQREVQE